MPGSLTNIGEEIVLEFLFNNSSRQIGFVFLGLIAGGQITEQDNLLSIVNGEIEVQDENYQRQIITFSSPLVDQETGEGYVENENEIQFGPWAADQPVEITQAFITDTLSGGSGLLLAHLELTHSRQPKAGSFLDILSGDLVFKID
jgi:hypothetical protein